MSTPTSALPILSSLAAEDFLKLVDASDTTASPNGTDKRITLATLETFLAGAFAPLASPTFSGVPAAPTASPGTNTTQIASTAFVQAATASLAPLASPALTGVPTAPTASAGTSTQQIATTAFTSTAVLALKSELLGGAPPAALDTLKELADALNDDASYAATITTALAGKQPISSNLTALASNSAISLALGSLTLVLAGLGLTPLNASQLSSGTVPDARFPATLPAASGANLTALNASQLTSGTVPAARGGAGSVNGILTANGSGVVSASSTTGTGSIVLSDSPTLSGLLTAGRVVLSTGTASEHRLVAGSTGSTQQDANVVAIKHTGADRDSALRCLDYLDNERSAFGYGNPGQDSSFPFKGRTYIEFSDVNNTGMVPEFVLVQTSSFGGTFTGGPFTFVRMYLDNLGRVMFFRPGMDGNHLAVANAALTLFPASDSNGTNILRGGGYNDSDVSHGAGAAFEVQCYAPEFALSFRESNGNSNNHYSYGGTLGSGGHQFFSGGLRGSQVKRLAVANDGVALYAQASAPSSSGMTNSSVVMWLDESGSNLKFQVKYSNGTVKTATVALS